MAVGQSQQVFLGVDDFRRGAGGSHQALEEHLCQKAPLADEGGIVIGIEDVEDLAGGLVVPLLRSVVRVEDEAVPIV